MSNQHFYNNGMNQYPGQYVPGNTVISHTSQSYPNGYINQPVNSWPGWSVNQNDPNMMQRQTNLGLGNTNTMQQSPDMFMRCQTNNYGGYLPEDFQQPQYQQQQQQQFIPRKG